MNNRMLHSGRGESCLALAERDVVEVPLLLPGWQVDALAAAAHDRGQTAGEMLRGVLQDFITGLEERRIYATH
jgi:hypothetical protein